MEESNISAELIAHRRRLVDEWNAWRVKVKEELLEERRKRGKKEPVANESQEEEKEEIEVWVDEVIEQIEEEIVE